MPIMPTIYAKLKEIPCTADIPEEESSPAGSKPYYEDLEEMQERIEEYFKLCDEGREIERYDRKRQVVHKYREAIPYTIPGLAYYLGFEDRHGLQDYEKKIEFHATIARARTRIEQQRVERALTGEQESRFAMFDLTNNSGYKAEQDIVVTPIQRRTYTAIEEQALRAQAIADARAELEKQQRIEHITDIAPEDGREGTQNSKERE